MGSACFGSAMNSGTTMGFGGGGGFGASTPTSSFGATQQTTSFGQASPAGLICLGQAAKSATSSLFGAQLQQQPQPQALIQQQQPIGAFSRAAGLNPVSMKKKMQSTKKKL